MRRISLIQRNYTKGARGMGVDFQYASSASVYGAAKTFNEEDFCKPLSPYAFEQIYV